MISHSRNSTGAGTNFNKGESYIPFGGMRTFDLFTERDERVHGQQRRLVASAYTMNAIKSLEPYVNHTTAVLLAKLGELSAKGQAVDIAYLLQLFAFGRFFLSSTLSIICSFIFSAAVRSNSAHSTPHPRRHRRSVLRPPLRLHRRPERPRRLPHHRRRDRLSQ